MFKKSFLLWLSLALLPLHTALAQSWKAAKYDTAWIPITEAEVAKQVRENHKDAVGLWQLWRRAQFQKQEQSYFSALEQLRKQEPKNGVLDAVRCGVIETSILSKGFPQFKIAQAEWASSEQRRAELEKAKKAAPNLWLNLLNEAILISWEQGSGIDPKVVKQQVTLAGKAVALAPNLSFTNNALAGYLSNLSRRGQNSDKEAIQFYRKAQQAAPINAGPSFGLHFHYLYNKPDKDAAKKAEHEVLATIPPSVKLTPRLKQFLVKQGVTPT